MARKKWAAERTRAVEAVINWTDHNGTPAGTPTTTTFPAAVYAFKTKKSAVAWVAAENEEHGEGTARLA